jgi:hypothetical protein
MLLYVTSVLCGRWCSDAATTATLRGAWWRTRLERGPHLVSVAGLWLLVLALLLLASGVLVGAFALSMRAHAAWPDARVWAPAALAPLMCALVLGVWLACEGALLWYCRFRLRNAAQPMTMVPLDTMQRDVAALIGDGEEDGEDD